MYATGTASTHLQRAAAVGVAGYSIETPRLLLNSTSARFPRGLGNDHDHARPLPHGAGRATDRRPVRPTRSGCTRRRRPRSAPRRSTRPTPAKPYKRGFAIQTVSPLPIKWAEHCAARGPLGPGAARVHARLRALGHPGCAVRVPAVPDNRVTLAEEKDRHGLPVAHFSLQSQCDNDAALMRAAAIGDAGHPARRRSRGCRHDRARTRTWSVAPGWPSVPRTASWSPITGSSGSQLWSTDGSVLPTQGSANPALTIMALAARRADLLAEPALRCACTRADVRPG